VTVAAVGDVANCAYRHGDDARATAELLRARPGVTVLVAGDIAYENGTKEDFFGCFEARWGFLKDRIRPAPGNHEYGLYTLPFARNDAAPYFAYFGASAGPPGKGFYSFDLGAWHVVSLNSMAGVKRAEAPPMDEQVRWLEDDLGRTGKGCVLAYWHHPLFSSGGHGHDAKDPGREVKGLWEVLARHHADVVVTGHDHHYERFAPQTAAGVADREHGIREFVAGTGGAKIPRVREVQPNSEVRLDQENDHGVLFLDLGPRSYGWTFVKTDGSVGDRSEAPEPCHAKTPG
jgi:hypothetical protein